MTGAGHHGLMACEIALPVLSDARVVVRGWAPEHAAALEPACGDRQICRFTTVPERFGIEDARAWIGRQQAHARRGNAAVLAIVPRPAELPVGMVGLFALDEPDSAGRLGYWLVAEWRGRGLASAAAALVADWGFTNRGLVAIQIDREPSNRASARVAGKLGAVVTGPHWVHYAGAEVQLVRHTLNSPSCT